MTRIADYAGGMAGGRGIDFEGDRWEPVIRDHPALRLGTILQL